MAYDSLASNRLAAVRSAIDTCLNAQDYTIGDRRKRMADLRDLRMLEKELMAETNGLRTRIMVQTPATGITT